MTRFPKPGASVELLPFIESLLVEPLLDELLSGLACFIDLVSLCFALSQDAD